MDHRSGTKVGGTFRAKAELLSHPGQIGEFLRRLVIDLGMTTLGTHIYDVPIAVKRMGFDCTCDEGGITGVTVLSTSHAAIHTWPEEGAACFDVHSCRPFDPQTVSNLINEMFDTDDLEMYDLTYSLKPQIKLINFLKNPNPEAIEYIQTLMNWANDGKDLDVLVR